MSERWLLRLPLKLVKWTQSVVSASGKVVGDLASLAAIDGTSQTVLTEQCSIIAFDRLAVFVCMFTKMVMGVTILNFMTYGLLEHRTV